MFERRIFCKIVVSLDDGHERVGTGCAVASNRVLTASHVVEDAQSFEFQFGESNESVESENAKVIWDGVLDKCNGAEVDVAVIAVEIPEQFQPNSIEWATGTVDGCEFESCGFGFLVEGIKDDGVFDFRGNIPQLTADTHQVLASSFSGSNPRHDDESGNSWEGVSGSSIFEQKGSRRLLAVVTDFVHEYDMPTVRAVRVPFLMRDHGFRQAAGISDRRSNDRIFQDAKARLQGMAEQLLENNRELCDYVAECNAVANEPPLVAAKIFSKPRPIDAIRECAKNKNQSKIDGLRDRIGQSICRLAELAAPLSFSSDYFAELESHVSGSSSHAVVQGLEAKAAVARAACIKRVSAKLDYETVDVSTAFDLVADVPGLPEAGAVGNDNIHNLCKSLRPLVKARTEDPVDVNAAVSDWATNEGIFFVVFFQLAANENCLQEIHSRFPDLILIANRRSDKNPDDAALLQAIKTIREKFCPDQNEPNHS